MSEEDRPKWHNKLSQQGREHLDQGFNPRAMRDEDYEVYRKHRKMDEGEDLVHSEDEDDEEGLD